MARDYSQWVPGQPVPAEPNAGDWFDTLLRSGIPLSGFYSDTLPFRGGTSFAGKVGDRAAWQERANSLGYLNGVDTFPPAKAPAKPSKTPAKTAPKAPARPSQSVTPTPKKADPKVAARKQAIIKATKSDGGFTRVVEPRKSDSGFNRVTEPRKKG